MKTQTITQKEITGDYAFAFMKDHGLFLRPDSSLRRVVRMMREGLWSGHNTTTAMALWLVSTGACSPRVDS